MLSPLALGGVRNFTERGTTHCLLSKQAQLPRSRGQHGKDLRLLSAVIWDGFD
jgi:hypothetical protein